VGFRFSALPLKDASNSVYAVRAFAEITE